MTPRHQAAARAGSAAANGDGAGTVPICHSALPADSSLPPCAPLPPQISSVFVIITVADAIVYENTLELASSIVIGGWLAVVAVAVYAWHGTELAPTGPYAAIGDAGWQRSSTSGPAGSDVERVC